MTYPWLSADLGGASPGLAVEVSVDGVVEEEGVLVEVVLGLLHIHAGGLAERELGVL